MKFQAVAVKTKRDHNLEDISAPPVPVEPGLPRSTPRGLGGLQTLLDSVGHIEGCVPYLRVEILMDLSMSANCVEVDLISYNSHVVVHDSVHFYKFKVRPK